MAYVLKEQGGKLDAEQKRVVKTILNTGRKMGASPKDLVTALITGIQESGLRNLPVAAENSGGWRQEKQEYFPDPTNVKHAAQRFFKELNERGGNGTLDERAQNVQRSAYPGYYGPHIGEAREILKRFNRSGNLGKSVQSGVQPPKSARGLSPTSRPVKAGIDKDSTVYKVAALNFIRNQDKPEALMNFLAEKESLNTPSVALPSKNGRAVMGQLKQNTGVKNLPNVGGSGNSQLVKWAEKVIGTDEGSPRQSKWAAASGISPSTAWCSAFVAYGLRKQGYSMPSAPAYSGAWLDWSGGKRVSAKNMKPGDIIVLDWGDGGITDHVGIYAGNGEYIAGNNSDNSVGRSSVPTGNIVGVVRPTKRRKRRR